MRIKKFYIYSADLNPRFGTESGKVRPVVVIQTNLLNDFHPSTIVCPITSKIVKNTKLLRIHLNKDENNLTLESDILVDQLRSIDNRRLRKELGKLTNSQRKKLIESLNLIVLQ